MARAAAARGTAMGLSSFASMPIEDVVAACPQTFFQIYWIGTRDQIAGPGRAGPGRRGGRPHRHPGLVLLPRARLGQPHHPRDGEPAGDAALRPRGPGPPALVPLLRPDREVARPDHAEHGGQGPAGADVLRRLRRVDADAAAELGRRGLAARAVGRALHAQGRDPGRRRQARRGRRRQRHFGVEPRRQQPRRDPGHHPRPARRSPTRSATRSRSSSTGASGAAATPSRPWRWAPRPS